MPSSGQGPLAHPRPALSRPVDPPPLSPASPGSGGDVPRESFSCTLIHQHSPPVFCGSVFSPLRIELLFERSLTHSQPASMSITFGLLDPLKESHLLSALRAPGVLRDPAFLFLLSLFSLLASLPNSHSLRLRIH